MGPDNPYSGGELVGTIRRTANQFRTRSGLGIATPVPGYFAARGSTLMTIESFRPWREGTELPTAFYISMGLRRGDTVLLRRLNGSLERNHTAISAILAEYHAPILPDAFALR
jgi:mxaJ protein